MVALSFNRSTQAAKADRSLFEVILVCIVSSRQPKLPSKDCLVFFVFVFVYL